MDTASLDRCRSIEDQLPADLRSRYGLRVSAAADGRLTIAASELPPSEVVEELAFLTGFEVRLGSGHPAPGGVTANGTTSDGSGVRAAPPLARIEAAPPPLPDWGSAGPVALVERLLAEAAGRRASDIHIEPFEARTRIRFRLDGVLHGVGAVQASQHQSVVARIKVMATLDIAEKRRPQDGRLRFQHDGAPIDVRVSTLPTGHGEKVVLRLLDRSQVILDLEEVGLAREDLDTFREAITRPHGMIVVTGPTGSGKTTTLYAALTALNTEDVNILTVEDPIEYELAGVNQTRVRPEIGFSFAEALRAFLRQDPDVVMVGEVRDRETAEIAVRAALTGHRVLTTLHTNDAATAVTRLADIGVAPYLVAASLRLVVAQRLVRKVCQVCVREVATSDADSARLGGAVPVRHLAGSGCDRCAGTGYRGRRALFELMPVTDDLADGIAGGADAGAIRSAARAAGLRTLREAGCKAVRTGATTPREVLRATS